MKHQFECIELRVVSARFANWGQFIRETPDYSIGLEVMDDAPGHIGHRVHFDHHAGVIREVTMSAAMQAYLAVRQGRLMQKWLQHRRPVPVYVWNADQDVCLAAFILEYHEVLERQHNDPLLRWIVQFNNKIDVCGGLYPVDLEEVVRNHFTWVFEPYRHQRMSGKTEGDAELVKDTIRQVLTRLEDLLLGRAGIAPITAEPEILYVSPRGFVIADEKGDPNSRLVLASRGYTNLISLLCTRNNGRYTYSVIRGSPYDEETFQVTRLIQAFQAAEDQPDSKIWGGSNMAAGSDSELGSSLDWRRLRDIAEPIVEAAWHASLADRERSSTLPAGSRVLLVSPASEGAEVERVLKESGVGVSRVSSCAEAFPACSSVPSFQAIFTARRLADGGYRDVVEMTRRLPRFVPVIVWLRQADGGWPDLLEAGASGVLAEPYRSWEVRAVLEALPCLWARDPDRECTPAGHR
jgi:hypothetical protein